MWNNSSAWWIADSGLSGRGERRDDHLADDVVALAVPESLPVVAGREHHREVELRHHQQQLAAIAVAVVGRDRSCRLISRVM